MHIIGITGPTGCGKTTLLRVIEVHGGFTVDCDALYYEMLRENAPMRAALTEAFGDIFLPDGSLDRPKLGNRVFSDPDALSCLNAIVYHHMGEKMRALLVEQAGQERNQRGTHQGDTAARHKLLDPLGFCTGVVVAVTFQKVDDTPCAETRAQGDHENFQRVNRACKKSHKVNPP